MLAPHPASLAGNTIHPPQFYYGGQVRDKPSKPPAAKVGASRIDIRSIRKV
jgi:hypothetical protein